MRRFWLKLLRRRRFEQDLEAEMAFHRDMARAAGNPVPFGNPVVVAEQARDLWRFTIIENLWRDVLHGARSLGRQPGLVASGVLSLALGVGANAAVFSLAMELLLSEPSVRDAATLVSVRDGGNSHTSPANLEAVRQSGLFADVAGQREEDAQLERRPPDARHPRDGDVTDRGLVCRAAAGCLSRARLVGERPADHRARVGRHWRDGVGGDLGTRAACRADQSRRVTEG